MALFIYSGVLFGSGLFLGYCLAYSIFQSREVR